MLKVREEDLKQEVLDVIHSAMHEWDKHHQGYKSLYINTSPQSFRQFFTLNSDGNSNINSDFCFEIYREKFVDIIKHDDLDDHFHPADFDFRYKSWEEMEEEELEEAKYQWRLDAIEDRMYIIRTEFLNDIVDAIAARHNIELEGEE